MVHSNGTCPRLSPYQLDAVFYTRVGACCLTFAACLASLVVLCVYVCWLRVWNTFVHRLKLYLTAVALVVSVLYLLQVLPMKLGGRPQDGHPVSRSWYEGCKVIIFLLQYCDWLLILLILWLVIYLCKMAWDVGRRAAASGPPQSNKRYHQQSFEVAGTVAVFVVPLLVIWTPFVGGYYGASDHKWCGMNVKANCSRHTESELAGLGYTIGTWYIPATLVTLAANVGIMIALLLLWRYYNRLGLTHQMKQVILKAIAPIVYLVLFNAINITSSSSVIYHSVSNKDTWNDSVDFGLWMAHAVTGPGRAMAIPFGFVLSHFFAKCCVRPRRDDYRRLN